MLLVSVSVQIEIVGDSPGANAQRSDYALNTIKVSMIGSRDRGKNSNHRKRPLTSSLLYSTNSLTKPFKRSFDKPAFCLRRFIPTVEGDLQNWQVSIHQFFSSFLELESIRGNHAKNIPLACQFHGITELPVQKRLSAEEVGNRLVRTTFGQYLFEEFKRQISATR